MILIDANLLIYAINRDAPLHRKTKLWLDDSLSGQETVALSWNVLLAVIRLTTRAGIFQTPIPVKAAFDIVREWLDQPSVVFLEPGPRHLRVLRDLISPIGTGGKFDFRCSSCGDRD